ncbi:MAG: queuosine precursor transporter [Bacteroidales bacterium]|nr:queuosine precursor transporter [Bacteroidales bacterium]
MSKPVFSTRFLVMAVTLTVCLITSNFFVPRLWQVAGLPLQLSGAVLLFPVSYILNDCITEVYGYRKARLVIWLAFLLSAFVALMAQLVCWLPAPLQDGSKPVAESFNSLFSMVPKTTAASLLAFFVGSTVNAWIMSRMKVNSRGRAFGVRAILSSLGGEFADSLIFFPVVFSGVMPFPAVLQLAVTQVCAKVLYEIVVLPLTSWFVRRVKQAEGIDVIDDGISYNPFRIKDI